MSSAILWISYQDDDHGQSETNSKRDMGVLLISLLAKKEAGLEFRERPAITKHLSNIFNSGELDKDSVSSILEHTAADGKTYKTLFYNLDAILSVGYRVNSINATSFRRWASTVLKQYLLRGYAVQRQIQQLERQIDLRVSIR